MQAALAQVRVAGLRGEVPVGAVIVDQHDRIVARAGNCTRAWSDPTAHAEIIALRQACAFYGNPRLF